jgi:Periplasmic binding protein
MKRSAAIATAAALLLACAFAAQAQEKVSDGVVKIDMLEDMSSIYADITGVGAVTAAKMAVEDFGGKVLGKPIEVIAADHQNKPDILSATAREWFDTQHVDALLDVAASATALAAIELAKAKNKIVVLNGPGATRITNEACTPVSIHYTYDTRSPMAPEPPSSKQATTLGSSLPPIMPSATTLRRSRPPSSERVAGRCSAACGSQSILWISPRRCCRRNPPKPR